MAALQPRSDPPVGREYQHALQQAVGVAASRQAELKQAQAELARSKAACSALQQQLSQLKVGGRCWQCSWCGRAFWGHLQADISFAEHA